MTTWATSKVEKPDNDWIFRRRCVLALKAGARTHARRGRRTAPRGKRLRRRRAQQSPTARGGEGGARRGREFARTGLWNYISGWPGCVGRSLKAVAAGLSSLPTTTTNPPLCPSSPSLSSDSSLISSLFFSSVRPPCLRFAGSSSSSAMVPAERCAPAFAYCIASYHPHSNKSSPTHRPVS